MRVCRGLGGFKEGVGAPVRPVPAQRRAASSGDVPPSPAARMVASEGSGGVVVPRLVSRRVREV